MYNTHRGMVPAPNSRLTELLDQLRQEFENQSRNTGEFEHQCMYPYSSSRLFSSFGGYSLWWSGASLSLPIVRSVARLSMTATHRPRNSLKCYLTVRSRSNRAAPGDGNDPSEGVSTGASPDQDEGRVRCTTPSLPVLLRTYIISADTPCLLQL